MGFFAKLKKNFNHGGVKLSITGPDPIRLQDPQVDVQLTLTNSSAEPASLLKVVVSLDFSIRADDPTATTYGKHELITSRELEPLVLQPNETKTVPVTLVLQAASVASQAGEGEIPPAAAAVVGVLGKFIDTANAMSQMSSDNNREYRYYAVADVDGVSFDPSASMKVRVLKPNEIASAQIKFGS